MFKKRSGKNLIHFFYHLLVVLFMSLPMLSGLVRVIYVQSNKNAFESYYGDTINEYTSYTLHTNNFEYLQTYYFNSSLYDADTITGVFFGYNTSSKFSFTSFEISFTNITTDLSNMASIGFYKGSADNYYNFTLFDNNNVTIGTYNSTSYSLVFKFTLSSMSVNSNVLSYTNLFYSLVYTPYSYLDNVYDYSLWKTMQDFTFHTNYRFTDIGNGMLMTFDNNNLYIQYANFYINWVLTCAVISFAPYVLLSFYHLAIHLLDKFMNKGEDL